VVPQLRARVSVLRHNLIRDPVPALAAGASVVFCRNVLIYFDRVDVLAALDRIASAMDPKGWVFLGYSESLWQVTDRFRMVRVGRAFAYQQPEAVPIDPPAQPLPAPGGRTPRGGGARGTQPTPAAVAPRGGHGSGAAAPDRAGPRDVPPSTVPPAATPGSAPAPACPPGAHGGDGEPSISALLAEGEAGLEAGDAAAAVAALRKVVYLDPDHAIAHFQLGLAFELEGDREQARRAFRVARSALRRSSAAAEAALEGYQIGELIRLIDRHLTRSPAP